MLDEKALRDYCLSQKGAVEEYPFGPGAAVYKVMGKMFALIGEGADPPLISLKCDPNLAMILRETYPAVQGAYHMNKRHWNRVCSDGSIPDDEIRDMIDASYDLVVSSLTRKDRERLNPPNHG